MNVGKSYISHKYRYVYSDRTFLFISLVRFKIVNSYSYNILMYYSNMINTFSLVTYLKSFISCNEITYIITEN